MDNTSLFKLDDIENALVKRTIIDVYNSLESRGYNATSQIIGYLVSGDPGYITSYNNARNQITSIEREKILKNILESYIKNNLWDI